MTKEQELINPESLDVLLEVAVTRGFKSQRRNYLF